MTTYYLSVKDYKDYFYEDTLINEKDYDFVMVKVKGIDNEEDRACEYSVSWICLDSNEEGKIYGINTSSYWSLASCYWACDESDDESDIEDEGFSEN